jgi:hypothetical protein
MVTASAGREMGKKKDGSGAARKPDAKPDAKPGAKPGAKTWGERREVYSGAQLYRQDTDRMTVLAAASKDAAGKKMSVAKWFSEALGPTLAKLYEDYVRSLADHKPGNPPRAASG